MPTALDDRGMGGPSIHRVWCPGEHPLGRAQKQGERGEKPKCARAGDNHVNPLSPGTAQVAPFSADRSRPCRLAHATREVNGVKASVEGYGMRIRTEKGFAETLQAAKAALAEQGFGVLTEIDVRETLKKKTGEELGHEYVILGACNPRLAHRALSREKEIGLFLPCNLIVYEDDGAVVVSAVNPMVSMERVANPELEDVANQATERLRAAVEAIH